MNPMPIGQRDIGTILALKNEESHRMWPQGRGNYRKNEALTYKLELLIDVGFNGDNVPGHEHNANEFKLSEMSESGRRSFRVV